MRLRHPLPLLAAGVAAVFLTTSAASAAGSAYAPVQRTNIGRAVPAGATLLPSGRLVSPVGTTSDQGDFPLGLAVSPDGVLAVTSQVGQGDGNKGGDFGGLCLDGQKKNPCAASQGRLGPQPANTPDEELLVTNQVTGEQTVLRSEKTLCNPAAMSKTTLNCFELGLVFSPDGKHLYATGGGNDAVYDFTVDPAAHTIATSPARVIYLQLFNGAPGGSGDYKKPNPGTQAARTKGLAITPDGSTLLVTEEQAGLLDLVRTSDFSFVQGVNFGPLNPTGANGSASYPYQVAVAPDGGTAYVSLQGIGSIAVVPLTTAAGAVNAGTPVSVPAGDHPTGLAVSPDGASLLVANANDYTVSSYALAGGVPGAPTSLAVHANPGEVIGAVPNAVAFAGDTTAYVTLAGDNAVAVLSRNGATYSQVGLLPTGWYPTSVAVRPGSKEILAVSAKGLGSRYTPTGGYPTPPATGGPQALNPGYYDGNNMPGLLQRIPAPSPTDLSSGTALVRRNLAYAAAADPAPAPGAPHGPIPLGDATAGQSPIKHVVYIVRENRTYDQVFGDLATTRNDVDADPAYESLAAATPNAHKVVGRYASSDSFFSDGEASIQGHYWTTSANVDDYVEKSWRQYYSDRNHSSDSVGTTVSGNRNCSIFQSAQAKSVTTPGFTYKDYGDPVGFANPSLSLQAPNGTPNPAGANAAGSLTPACPALPAANADLTNFGNFLGTRDTDSADRFLADNGLSATGDATPGGNTLKNFSYLELPLDHTTGFKPQGPTNVAGLTPRAQVADNDAAVGKVISSLSKSSTWSSTAVFVIEDDNQDGPDHVDGHRNILLVASPYARQDSANGCYSGYVGSVHNDQAGVLRTIELMLGLPSLSSYDAGAAPLYDLFQNKNNAAQLTPTDLAPYEVAKPAPFQGEKVGDPSAGSPSQQAALRAATAKLDLKAIDRAGPGLEDVIWRSSTNKPEPRELVRRLSRSLHQQQLTAGDDGVRSAAVDDEVRPANGLAAGLSSGVAPDLVAQPAAACAATVGGATPSSSPSAAATASPSASASAVPGAGSSGSPSPGASGTATPSGSAAPAASQVAGLYHPLQPQRILDTRTESARISAGADRPLQVTGAGGVPASGVSAVVLAVVVPQPLAAGDLEVYPDGRKPSPRTSNLNWPAHKTVANAVTVAVGDSGKVDLSVNTGRVDAAVDVLGWYGDDTDTSGGRYTALTPNRVLDTGNGSGRLEAATDRRLVLRGVGGVPDRSDVTGVVLNVTALDTPTTADVEVYPTGDKPSRRTSNTNLHRGQVSAVLVQAALGADGSVGISLSRNSARVVVDVLGYYSGSGGRFVTLTPRRIADRVSVTAGKDTTQQVGGANGIPADAASVMVNTTGVSASRSLDLQVYPTGERPSKRTSLLNLRPGQAVPNLDLATLSNGSLTMSASQGSVKVILDAVGYFTAN